VSALPPTQRPLDAAILAIDSARRSGFALYVRGELVRYGECNARCQADRLEVIARAQRLAAEFELRLGFVVEAPFGGTLATALSLTASLELWRDSWRALGGVGTRVLQLRASDWRAQVFGKGSLPRDVARHLEQVMAQRIARLHIGDEAPPIGGDSAAAICLGYTQLRSSALRAALRCELVPARGQGHGSA
jgi:hypothetical protein